MINFIISDENKDAVETKNVVENYMMNFDIDVRYHLLDINDNFKEKVKIINGFKIYILNIDSIKLLGLEYAEYIRSELDDWNSIIILVTKHGEIKNEILGRKLFLFDIIVKNCFYNKVLREDLSHIKKHYENRDNCLTFESNRIIKKLDFKNIDMITKEKDSKKCLIKSSIGSYYTSETLKNVCKRLDNRFIKINRSCIVNFDKVKEYDINKNKITLKNGTITFDISRDNKKSITSKFNNYK